MKSLTLEQQIEALLFVAGRPLNTRELTTCLETSADDVAAGLKRLESNISNRGLVLVQNGNDYELASHPSARQAVERFQNGEVRSELSKPAVETLAIIAYRQPITRSDIEEIRGVASDQTIKNLLMRGLICEAGKSKEPGKPTLYATTPAFLRHFGLTRPADLPSLESFEKN